MARLMYRIALGIAAVTVAGGALRAGPGLPLYRYRRPHVVYSDRPPSGDVKNLQTKRMGSNFISTSEPGYAAALAADRFPVTLYTFACGEVCQNAEAAPQQARASRSRSSTCPSGRDRRRLMALTNESTAPVLTVGDKLVAKGYSEAALAGDARRGGLSRRRPRVVPRQGSGCGRTRLPQPSPEGTKAVGSRPARRRLPEVAAFPCRNQFRASAGFPPLGQSPALPGNRDAVRG